MSRLISELLGAREPDFSLTLRRLERSSGQPAADINLATEIQAKIRQKSRELGLDPTDSSGPELYSALLKLTALHDGHLRRALGIKDSADSQELLERVRSAATKLKVPRQTWALKTSVARRLLSRRPPKATQKLLGYRSLDSMLKRENIIEIYIGAKVCESPLWQKRFAAELKTVAPHDFEVRPIEIVLPPPNRWNGPAQTFLKTNHHNLAVSFELGGILLLPLPGINTEGLAITILPLLLERINEIRAQSAYFKLRQVRPGFGRVIAAAFHHGLPPTAKLDGLNLPWRTLHHHFAHHPTIEAREIFEPHLQPEDLLQKEAEDTLYYLEPSLAFWRELNYAGHPNQPRPVSFNLSDMAVSYLNKLPYGRQSVRHLRNNLWNQLLGHYLRAPTLQAEVLRQLDDNLQRQPFGLGSLQTAAA